MASDKTDMNRVGLFKEMEYITVADPYVPSSKFTFNDAAYKGKQMLPGPIKSRATGLQDGYFIKDKTFPRVFEKEAYTDPIGTRRRHRVEEAKKNLSKKPFITFKGETKGEGLGSTYGLFNSKLEYFSRKEKEGKPFEPSKPNIKTNPPKQGTGYGYAGVGLDKYPEYKSDKYGNVELAAKENAEKHNKLKLGPAFRAGLTQKEFFEKNPYLTASDGAVFREKSKSAGAATGTKPFKYSSPPKSMGNVTDGGFTKFPTHMEEKYTANGDFKPLKRVVNNSGKVFVPQQWGKSKPQTSVINHNVGLKVNATNFRQGNQFATYHFNTAMSH